MVQLSLDPIKNEKLFSRHYLEERLPESDTWEEDEEKVKKAFEEIKELYEKERGKLKKYKEAQLEKNFIWEILDIINPYYEIRETTKSGDLEPDYGFFKNEKDLDNAHVLKEEKDFYKNVIAVGDAKRWGTPLDKQDKNAEERWDKTNPSYQIFVYLKETPADWGILTDGRYWRLYTAEEAQSLEVYYQVDLISILENENLEAFKYFYHFFRRKAFIRDESGESFLDKVYTRSVRYAKSVGKDLENRLYRALELMAKGYFDVKTNRIDEKSLDKEKHLETVHENSLIFLYRLIFVLYAEANGLLKSEKIPSEYDVNQIIEDALDDPALDVEHLDEVEETSALYDWRLNRIFKLIDQGSEEYDVPAYDGGLFDNDKYPFFKIRESDKEHNKIRNNYLAYVIKLLTKTEGGEGEGETRIDYADLSIKHIGGIYEGLLEHDLKIAEDSKVVCVDDEWIPLSDTERDFEDFDRNDRAEKGEIYLATDEGERKATGSYYTPEYIVDYIVENTLGPLVDERFEEIDEKHPPDEEPDKNQESKREAVLSLDVLDPAMGSAHFLVEATDFLAQKLSPYLREEELDDVDEKEHSDKTIAKRLVLKNCIYGVDINPLATELAKVSLWLTTIMSDKPLQFLSHHLKTGNSLIGADIDELATHPKKSGEKEKEGLKAFVKDIDSKEGIHEKMRKLIGVFKDLEEQREDERADINREKEIYDKFLDSDFRVKFDILVDVYTSYYFGNEFSEKKYQKLLNAFKEGGKTWEEIIQEDWVRRATDSAPSPREDNLSNKKSFFHWQLEFPDIFFDLESGHKKESPGFDIVLGNPPHGAETSEEIRNFQLIKNILKDYDLKDESAIYFQILGNYLSKDMVGFVMPKPLSYNDSWSEFRDYVMNESPLINFIDLGCAFKGQLQEQVAMITAQYGRSNYITGYSKGEEIIETGSIPHKNYNLFEIFLLSLDEDEIAIGKKIVNGKYKKMDFLEAHRGIPSRYRTYNKGRKVYEKKHIKRYFLKESNSYLLENFEHSKLKKMNRDKVIAQRIMSYTTDPIYKLIPKACKDGEGLPTLETAENIYLKDRAPFGLKFLTALINSRFVSWYLSRFIYTKRFETSKDFDESYIKKIVIPEKIDDEDEKIIKEKSSKLSNLIQEREKEKNSFLNWLSVEWKVKIENISRKTYLKKYWKHKFEGNKKCILDIAKHNKNKINADLSSKEFQENLRSEWKKSRKKIRKIEKEIKKYENELDFDIFNLYDLTEEEVETVLDSLDTPEEEREDIMEKFREVKEN